MSGLIEGSWFLISVPVMLTITWSQTLKTPLCTCERMKMKKAKEKPPQTKPLLSWKWLAEPPKQSWGAPGHTWRITNPCGLTLPCFSGLLYTLSCLLNTPPSTSAASNFKKKTAVRRKLHQGPTPAPPPLHLCAHTPPALLDPGLEAWWADAPTSRDPGLCSPERNV